jgi:hypothetical protein
MSKRPVHLHRSDLRVLICDSLLAIDPILVSRKCKPHSAGPFWCGASQAKRGSARRAKKFAESLA